MLKSLLALLALGSLCVGASAGRHISSVKDQDDVIVQDSNSGRIVGGRTVDISLHPHQVSLRFKSIFSTSAIRDFICGGSIISSTMIVTAAHCVIDSVPREFHVVAGANQREASDGVVVPVEEIIMHNYNSDGHDIALLKLAIPLPLNNFTIKAIELADSVAKEGEIATVTGWGNTGITRLSDFLQEVKVPIISNELCNKDYNPMRIITDNMICAGFRGVGGKDACNGDSGGPMVINGKLAGVVSWGFGCASPKYPGVYTRISYELPWLLAKIAQYQ